MLPRGGECPGCNRYTLWGDIIRGCYRRHLGRAVEATVDATEEEEGALDDESEMPGKVGLHNPSNEDEHETFDLDAVTVSDDDEEMVVSPPKRKPRKQSSATSPPTKRSVGRSRKVTTSFSVGQTTTFKPMADIIASAPKRRGRPPKQAPPIVDSAADFFSLESGSDHEHVTSVKAGKRKVQKVSRTQSKTRAFRSTTPSDDDVDAAETMPDAPMTPRPPRRPRKTPLMTWQSPVTPPAGAKSTLSSPSSTSPVTRKLSTLSLARRTVQADWSHEIIDLT